MDKLFRPFLRLAKTLALISLTTTAFTQNLDAIEKDLVEVYAPISSFFRIDYDSLQFYSQRSRTRRTATEVDQIR